MKKKTGLLVLMIIIGMGVLFAQNRDQNRKGEGDRVQHMKEMNEKAKKDLNLSEEQSIQWDQIHQKYFGEMTSIKKDETLSHEARKEKMSTMKKRMDEELKGILSAEQKPLYDDFIEENRKQRRNGNNGYKSMGRMDGLKNELNLSDGQSEKWDEIHKNYRKKAREVKDDGSLSDEARKEKGMNLRGEMSVEIMAILDSEQQAAYMIAMDKRKQEMKQKRQGQR